MAPYIRLVRPLMLAEAPQEVHVSQGSIGTEEVAGFETDLAGQTPFLISAADPKRFSKGVRGRE